MEESLKKPLATLQNVTYILQTLYLCLQIGSFNKIPRTDAVSFVAEIGSYRSSILTYFWKVYLKLETPKQWYFGRNLSFRYSPSSKKNVRGG